MKPVMAGHPGFPVVIHSDFLDTAEPVAGDLDEFQRDAANPSLAGNRVVVERRESGELLRIAVPIEGFGPDDLTAGVPVCHQGVDGGGLVRCPHAAEG